VKLEAFNDAVGNALAKRCFVIFIRKGA
jgi:hypothetical protein